MPLDPPAWTAIIPLRAGSKGLPGKNLRPLAGRPLYRHALDQALAAGAARIVITTDLTEVLDAPLPPEVVCVPRPAELAGDAVPMAPVLVHALQQAQVQGTAVLLQATSPLRTPQDIRTALELFATGQYGLVMSVTEADRGVLKWGRLEGQRFVPLSAPEHCFANRQSLPPVVRPNGAVYVFDSARLIATGSLAADAVGVVTMPAERSHDIDNLNDFEQAERLLATLPQEHP